MNLTCIWRRPKSVGFVEHVNDGGVKCGDVRGNVSTTASQPSAYPPPELAQCLSGHHASDRKYRNSFNRLIFNFTFLIQYSKFLAIILLPRKIF